VKDFAHQLSSSLFADGLLVTLERDQHHGFAAGSRVSVFARGETMTMLLLSIILFPLFFFGLACGFVGRSLESNHSSRTRIQTGIQTLETSSATLSIGHAFNPIYAVLWEEPLAALRLIESSGQSGIRVERLQPIFNQAAVRFPEIYDGYTFSQWLEFLEGIGLIVWGDRVKLTLEGQAFLTSQFVTDKHNGDELIVARAA
jgi:hypothetical protein